MKGFRQALEDSNLIQIPIVGSFFTREKGRESNNLVREKLDRALATEDWAHKFTNVVCSGLAEVVKGAWVNSIPCNLLMKRDDLVSALSLWSRSRNREFWQKKKTILRLLDNGPSTVSHASLKEDWNRLLKQEEARLKQQAKCFWLKNGDRNTKFFHAQINGRRRMNRISKLKESSGTWIEDE
ncbi:uncharacterized protein LOC122723953 [Manihot esculenta]|uniref:uncharacterized protein LOC122723953 n=1 Tax=Manihot esculenta TaxID=3983 RepID=UPI001CC53C9B|nr:uncharacterized protein LOC122723953 [Manihot esculenta]